MLEADSSHQIQYMCSVKDREWLSLFDVRREKTF